MLLGKPKVVQLEGEQRAAIKARQGVAFPMMEHITVMDQSMSEVPKDGKTQGNHDTRKFSNERLF